MKRMIVIMVVLALGSQLSYGQYIDRLFSKYKGKANAEYVNLNAFRFGLVKLLASLSDSDDEELQFFRRLKSVRVLDMEDCDADTKERFARDVRKCSFKGYEELMRVADDGEQMRIYAKMKGDVLTEFVLFAIGDGYSLIQLKGNIRQSDIDRVIHEHNDKKKEK